MDPKLVQVLAENFQVDPTRISEASSPKTLPDWDSLAHLNLVGALEKAFGITFNMDDIFAMKDAGAIARLLEKKCAG